MNPENFVNKVMHALPETFYNGEVISLEDILLIKKTVAEFYAQGWLFIDALNYCRCMEEVNPTLDEAIALARMEKIRAKYSMPAPLSV